MENVVALVEEINSISKLNYWNIRKTSGEGKEKRKGKGKGFFVTKDVKSGALILEEKPLFRFLDGNYLPNDICNAYKSLNTHLQREYWNLASVHRMPFNKNTLPDESDHHAVSERAKNMIKVRLSNKKSIESIFYTNAVATDGGASIFLLASRINHSCIPNASYYWNKEKEQLEIRLVKDLEANQEVFISYIEICQPKVMRYRTLYKNYGFKCDCIACGDINDPQTFAYQSFNRRYLMASVLSRVYEFELHKELPEYESFIEALGEEGLVIPMKAVICKRIGEIWIERHHNRALAIQWLQKAVNVFTTCYGENASETIQTLNALESLQKPEESWKNPDLVAHVTIENLCI